MSSFPLISHHLFVAAVNEKARASRAPGPADSAVLAPDIRVREITVELIDFGRPLPIEGAFQFGPIRQHRRTK